MPKTVSLLVFLTCAATIMSASDRVKIDSGTLAGTGPISGVRAFLGVPFAAPPVGSLRWQPPQPVAKWNGVRAATSFGLRCMQNRVFDDMVFRDPGPSEDCLNLNIWTPATSARQRLPVIVWFYGGGFVAGANSEPRYDGANLAAKGVIVVSPNYRLGVFGFFAHADLSKESGHNASGNYGLLDEVAALQWVQRNIAAFGGDAQNVTIAGESAGSFSVSALMASPLAQGLFQKAIGESGAFFSDGASPLETRTLSSAEKDGADLAGSLGAHSLEKLRALPADTLLRAVSGAAAFRFGPIVDGYFLPQPASAIYAAGHQSHVPLLAGWNADEGKSAVLFAKQQPTPASFAERARKRFGDDAQAFLKLYPAATEEETLRSAADFAGDNFIAYSTWKWLNEQVKNGAPVYRYHFEQVPAFQPGAMMNGVPAKEIGARHSAEIEYVFETLLWQDVPWTPDDFAVSDAMGSYWANFARAGDPNGPALPKWPQYNAPEHPVMHLLGGAIHAAAEERRDRYEFLDAHAGPSAQTGQKAAN